MRQYKSLGEAQRSLAIQVVILTIAALLFALTGRLMIGNRFIASFALPHKIGHVLSEEDITIKVVEETPDESANQEGQDEQAGPVDRSGDQEGPETKVGQTEENGTVDGSETQEDQNEQTEGVDGSKAQNGSENQADQAGILEGSTTQAGQGDLSEPEIEYTLEKKLSDESLEDPVLNSNQDNTPDSAQKETALNPDQDTTSDPESEQKEAASTSDQNTASDFDRKESADSERNPAAKQAEKAEEKLERLVLKVSMLPHKAGKYAMIVADRTGTILIKDEIYVGKYYTAFSKETGSFTGDETLILAGILYYLGLCLIMLIFLRRLSGPLVYSYEAILSCGVFIFAMVTLIIQVPVYINHLRSPETCTTWQLLYDFGAGGKYFTIFTAPIVIVFCILLIISNLALLRHERPRFQNFLGLLLGFLLILGEGIYYLIYSNFNKVPSSKHLIASTVINIIGITFTYAECVLFSSVICGIHAAKYVPKPDRDYILILGCGFRKDGSLPPLLKGRVDKAMEFWRKQKESTGKEAVVIPSGGQGENECMAEAEAMYRYMVASGFPDKLIIRENQSANTYQNMTFSKKIIETVSPVGKDIKTAFVTTNYHVFRSGVWAGLAGLKAEGLGSRTKWWYWPNAFVRECVGLLYNRLKWEIFYLAILIFIFTMITRLAYL